jgi:hypothetical protein
MAKINFSKYSTQNNLTQITQVKQFNPFKEKKGVCTSLEEWALRILQSNQEFQLKVLYVNDPEKAQHWDRVTEKYGPLLKSQKRILLYPTLTVTQGTTISRDWILRQTDMKDNQTRN